MVHDVVAVVERQLVLRRVHAVVRERVVGAGALRVDENVLAPVAEHERERAQAEGQDEHRHGGHRVQLVQAVVHKRVPEQERQRVQAQAVSLAGEGVDWQLEVRSEEEARPVVQEVQEVVPLVRLRGRHVVGEHVVLLVVHHHVVKEVLASRHAEQRREHDFVQLSHTQRGAE